MSERISRCIKTSKYTSRHQCVHMSVFTYSGVCLSMEERERVCVFGKPPMFWTGQLP